MNTEDAQTHAADGVMDVHPRKDDLGELAERAADAATELYVTHEHEQRRRRFELALLRAADAER
ncbi:MAG: hypothetical protein KJ747_10200 [Actinobacteria bacterium]|nr:hypothetical protein [Actinomycetota bacterium]MCG2807674.1 hypothetical protein [Coriobacteriia bacterium]MDP2233416.1 hypothetical protein [Actinomycetota bacterium]